MPSPRDIAISRLDDEGSLPGGSRDRLFRLVSKYRPDQLEEVERVLRANGIRDEDIIDISHEILDDTTPGGFGPDPSEPPRAVQPSYAPREMSGGQTIADVIGKLMGGIAVGASEPQGGNPAAAAAGYVRDVRRDQQSLEAGRRRDSIVDRRLTQEDRRISQEDKRFSWEERREAQEQEAASPNSPMAQTLRDSMIKAASEKFGPPPPEKLKALNKMNAEQLKVLASQQNEEMQQAIENEFKQQQIALSREGVAASRENAAASRGISASNAASTAAYREAMLADKSERREAEEVARQAAIYDKEGPEGLRRYLEIKGAPAMATATAERPGINMLPPATQRAAEKKEAETAAVIRANEANESAKAKASVVPNLRELKGLLEKHKTDIPFAGITGRTTGLLPSFGEDAQRAEQIMAEMQVTLLAMQKGPQTDRDMAKIIQGSLNPDVRESVNIKAVDDVLSRLSAMEKRSTGRDTSGGGATVIRRTKDGRKIEYDAATKQPIREIQ